eukprot:COSAG06_NODE_13891_length_1208_cov_1.575293_3_plen_82_part_00
MQARFHCTSGKTADFTKASSGTRQKNALRRFFPSTIHSAIAENQDEIADLCLFLCSDRAANITGSSYSIDGGLMAVLPERS